MTEIVNDVKEAVSEKDKPFILALIGSAITALTGLAAFLNMSWINPEAAMKIFNSTLPLTSMAWGYYLAAKKK